MPKIVDHDKYREQLLYQSFDLFALRGYSNVTMREIADHLKISTGSLYHYFPNKEGMMDNLFKTVGVREVEKAYAFSIEGKTAVERLDRLFRYVLDHETFFQNILRMALDYSRIGSKGKKEDTLTILARFIQDKISEGAFDIGREFGMLMLNMLSGILVNRLIFSEEVKVGEQLRLSIDLIKAYLDGEEG